MDIDGTSTSDATTPLDTAQLLEYASKIAREVGRQEEKEAAKSKPKNALPYESDISRIIAKAFPSSPPSETSVKEFADGMLRISTPYGTTYCLQKTPESAKGGPAEPISVPLVCLDY